MFFVAWTVRIRSLTAPCSAPEAADGSLSAASSASASECAGCHTIRTMPGARRAPNQTGRPGRLRGTARQSLLPSDALLRSSEPEAQSEEGKSSASRGRCSRAERPEAESSACAPIPFPGMKSPIVPRWRGNQEKRSPGAKRGMTGLYRTARFNLIAGRAPFVRLADLAKRQREALPADISPGQTPVSALARLFACFPCAPGILRPLPEVPPWS